MKNLKSLLLILFALSYPLNAQILEVQDIQHRPDSVILSIGENHLVIEFCKDNIIMFNFLAKDKTNPELPIIAGNNWEKTNYNYQPGKDEININTGKISLKIKKHPFSFSLKNGELLLLGGPVNFKFDNEKICFESFGKNYYGISNRQNGNLTTNNGDTIRAGEQGDAGGPFVWTTSGFGLLFESDGGKIIIDKEKLVFENKKNTSDNFKFYFFTGNPEEIFSALTDITGKPPLFPKWSMGFMNTEWGIDQDELIKHIKTYREKDIPLDAFILDFDWMDWGKDNYGEFRWGSKFPDAENGKLKIILDFYGVNLCGIRKPRIHTETIQGKYTEENKFFIRYETDYFSKKKVGLLDFYKPEVQRWYWDCFIEKGNSYSYGITGYWNDEADAYGGNFMFTYMQKAQYEGQRRMNNRRVFSLNRNFYTGNQKYAYAHWSGDIHTGFKSMAEQRLFMLTSVNLGSGWWSMDIAGFKGNPSEIVYSRWMQFGAFVPIYRIHATENKQRQPWVYDKETEETAVKYIRLRYELLPYIYSYAWENHNTGVSITKPLIFNYPEDGKVGNLYSEFLFGNELLVSPITTDNEDEELKTYLPKGDWYNFWTEEKLSGEKSVSHSLTEKDIPLYVKAGAIIPTQKYGKNVYDREALRSLFINCYAGPDNLFTLYEDDGLTYDYEKGEYSLTTFSQRTELKKRTLKILKVKNKYKSSIENYIIKFKQTVREPDEISVNNKIIKKNSGNTFNTDEWFYDKEKKVCEVRVKNLGIPIVVEMVF